MREEQINSEVRRLQISGIRQFFNQVQAYPDAVQLTLGQPDFPTPEHIKQAAKSAVDQNKTTYTANAGTMELRSAAAAWLAEKYDLHYASDTEVIVTVGASQALDVTMRTILEPGDEVIIPAPVYPAYEPLVRQCGAEVVYADTRATSFMLTPDHLNELITDKTKAVMLPYPSNPTGRVMKREEMEALHRILKEKELFVICDEIYSELRYDGTHESIASLPEMKEKTIVINGLSKSHSMTGWRIGFLFAPAWIASHMIKVHQYNVSCASSVSQAAALEALTKGSGDPEAMRKEYAQRRRFVVDSLRDIGVPVVEPEGAFYVFPDISSSGLSSEAFAVQLLDQEELAVVPGTAFSNFGEGGVRLSYAYSMRELEEAIERFRRFWSRCVPQRSG
ncbi:aminotransferase A [Alkalicoccus chagannorensis]|uniref:aminotransferase A n=1 Tax=Alkalicoccus chagannorensis TaxID=427072 RepID=UPI0003FF2BBF|nr:aminotransferase A [Alkalicoccus chagannorensis]